MYKLPAGIVECRLEDFNQSIMLLGDIKTAEKQ